MTVYYVLNQLGPHSKGDVLSFSPEQIGAGVDITHLTSIGAIRVASGGEIARAVPAQIQATHAPQGVGVFTNNGVPDGTTYAGIAAYGSLCWNVAVSPPAIYVNTGTIAAPTWTTSGGIPGLTSDENNGIVIAGEIASSATAGGIAFGTLNPANDGTSASYTTVGVAAGGQTDIAQSFVVGPQDIVIGAGDIKVTLDGSVSASDIFSPFFAVRILSDVAGVPDTDSNALIFGQLASAFGEPGPSYLPHHLTIPFTYPTGFVTLQANTKYWIAIHAQNGSISTPYAAFAHLGASDATGKTTLLSTDSGATWTTGPANKLLYFSLMEHAVLASFGGNQSVPGDPPSSATVDTEGFALTSLRAGAIQARGNQMSIGGGSGGVLIGLPILQGTSFGLRTVTDNAFMDEAGPDDYIIVNASGKTVTLLNGGNAYARIITVVNDVSGASTSVVENGGSFTDTLAAAGDHATYLNTGSKWLKIKS